MPIVPSSVFPSRPHVRFPEKNKKQKKHRFQGNFWPHKVSYFFLFFFWLFSKSGTHLRPVQEIQISFAGPRLIFQNLFSYAQFSYSLLCICVFALTGGSRGSFGDVLGHVSKICIPEGNGLLHPKPVAVPIHGVEDEILSADPSVEQLRHIGSHSLQPGCGQFFLSHIYGWPCEIHQPQNIWWTWRYASCACRICIVSWCVPQSGKHRREWEGLV